MNMMTLMSSYLLAKLSGGTVNLLGNIDMLNRPASILYWVTRHTHIIIQLLIITLIQIAYGERSKKIITYIGWRCKQTIS